MPARRCRGTALLIAYCSLSAVASAAPANHEIPLRMVGNYPVIEASIDGYDRPLRLIVDTAAGVSALDRWLVERLKLIDSDAERAQVSGASGTAHSVQFAQRLDLTLAGTRFTIKPLVTEMARFSHGDVSASARYDGIIGNDLMRQFDLRFDVPAGVLVLSEPTDHDQRYAGSQCQDNGFGAERPAQLSGFALVDIAASAEQSRTAIEAVVDTGAAQTLFNWAAIEALGFGRQDARLRERTQGTHGFGGQKAETFLATLDDLGFAEWSVGPMEVRIADLPVFQALGLADKPAVILGIDALQHAPLLISGGVSRICLG